MDDPEQELAALRAIGRDAGIDASHPLEPLEQPPPDLWDRIAGEIGLGPTPVRDDEPEVERTAQVTPLAGRRRRTWLLPAAAAAAVAAIVAVVGGIAIGGSDDPEVVASAALERLGDSGSGSAELVADGGDLRLRLDTSDVDAGDGFVEVWVIDTALERLVSLGPLRPDGVYELPTGLDPETFPVVDVSREPFDGDPAHSGDSVLRGQLQF